jgi:hypothetical protein
MRKSLIGILLVGATLVAGCQPTLDPQRYGEILNDLPKIKGAEKPFPLPQLEEKPEEPAEDQK